MPQLFSGVRTRTFWWCSPPVDTIVFEKFPCSRCMFRVILHEPVTTRIISLQTWEQCILEDLDVKTHIHPPFKNADVCLAIPANSSPNMGTFTGCLARGFRQGGSLVLRQQNRLCDCSWTVVSSVQTTSWKLSWRCSWAHSKQFCWFTSRISWQ